MKQVATSAALMGAHKILKAATYAKGIKANRFTTYGVGALARVITV
jgi:solute carrier family 25 citrate transporter 1